MSKRIFIVYGHHDTKKCFNQEIRDTFISEAKKLGHQIDLINLHEEKTIPFYDGTEPSEQILDYRKRLEKSDVLFMISPCYNLRATAILENPETIPFPVLASSIHLRESNLLTREGVIPISKLAMNSNISNSNIVSWMQEKIPDLGYSPANAADVEVVIDETISEMNEMVRDRGFGAIGPLMGVVMKKLGGTADGKLVNKLLKSKIEDLIK